MARLQTITVSSFVTAPPGSPALGDQHLVIATGTGAFTGKENLVATYGIGGWVYMTLKPGATIYNVATGSTSIWNGSSLSTPTPVTFHYNGTATTAANGRTMGMISTTANAAKLKVPTGKTFKVLGCIGAMTSGATNGTYTIDIIVRNTTDSADVIVATVTIVVGGGAVVTQPYDAAGTLDVPLGTLAAGKEYLIGWFNRASSPAALSADQKSVFITGVFV